MDQWVDLGFQQLIHLCDIRVGVCCGAKVLTQNRYTVGVTNHLVYQVEVRLKSLGCRPNRVKTRLSLSLYQSYYKSTAHIR